MLHNVASFQHDNSTYRGARLIHWMVLQGDVAGVRERQEELGQARNLTCTTQDEDGDTSTNVSVLPPCSPPSLPSR